MNDGKKLHLGVAVPFDFSIYFTRDFLSSRNKIFRSIVSGAGKTVRHRMVFFIEEELANRFPDLCSRVRKHCALEPGLMDLVSDLVVVNGGEAVKNFKGIEKLCGIINANGLCRHSFVCIIGGGALLDAVGFSASIVHRGIRQIRFPTTVLSQADSGVGVKNGINMFGKKNFIGTFAPPYAVVNDFSFLDTLSLRDWISGISEAFKVAMIKDADFFRRMCSDVRDFKMRNPQKMEDMIFRCAQLHVEHIMNSGDPFEQGGARPLDFGHWAAHKLETMSGGQMRHGEAVAIGILIDSFYASRKRLISAKVLEDLENALSGLGFNLFSDLLTRKSPDGGLEILRGIEEFREHLGGELHITLPKGLGRKVEVGKIDEDIMVSAIRYLEKKYG